MENETKNEIDYAAVLADLLAKREVLDKMIDGARSFVGHPSPKASVSSNSFEIKSDTFFGTSVPDAIRKLLGMKRKPMTPAEIAEYLENGGMTHSSVSFVNTVGSVLHRLAKGDTGVILVKRGQYGLAEWYPGRRKVNKKNDTNEESDDQDKDGE